MTRFLTLAVTVLSISAGAATAAEEHHDIAWYKAHPAERRAQLIRCHGDAAIALSFNCQNAEHADASQMGRALSEQVLPNGKLKPGIR
jgi:hypothetical protein